MLQGLTPKDVEKLTGVNHKEIQQKRVMIRRKAKQEIEKYGCVIGVCKGFIRILKCNPFSKGGYDPLK